MYFKEQRYEKAKTLSLATTYTKQLPESGILDSIDLFFRSTNASNMSGDAPLNMHHHITKLEVIGNTDKTLFSLTGEEAIAKAYRKMGVLPEMHQDEYGGVPQHLCIPILFGRMLKDGLYALDLSKWDKVELNITNDFSSTYHSGLSVDIRLCTIEDSAASYPKFLKQWEYQKDKPAADGDYVRPKLPTTGRLRSLMIQLDPDLTATTAAVAQDPISDNYNWKMWFKDRSLTIYDHRPKDIIYDEHRRLGIGVSSCKPLASTTRYTDFHWSYVLNTALAIVEATGDSTITSLEASNNRYQKFKYVGGLDQNYVIIKGLGLFHTFEIPFYYPADTEDNYLDLDRYKPIEIEWYGYKDDNTHRMILEKPIGQGPAEYA